MRRATGKPEAALPTIEYLVYRSQRWNCRMHGDKITSQKLSRCSKNISMRNTSLKTWVKNRRSTSSVRNHNSYSKIWTKQRSSNFAIILQNFTVLRYNRSPTTTEKANCDFCFNPWLCHEEEFQSRTKARRIWKTDHVLQGEGNAWESETIKARRPSNDSRKEVSEAISIQTKNPMFGVL